MVTGRRSFGQHFDLIFQLNDSLQGIKWLEDSEKQSENIKSRDCFLKCDTDNGCLRLAKCLNQEKSLQEKFQKFSPEK